MTLEAMRIVVGMSKLIALSWLKPCNELRLKFRVWGSVNYRTLEAQYGSSWAFALSGRNPFCQLTDQLYQILKAFQLVQNPRLVPLHFTLHTSSWYTFWNHDWPTVGKCGIVWNGRQFGWIKVFMFECDIVVVIESKVLAYFDDCKARYFVNMQYKK